MRIRESPGWEEGGAGPWDGERLTPHPMPSQQCLHPHIMLPRLRKPRPHSSHCASASLSRASGSVVYTPRPPYLTHREGFASIAH